MADISFPTQDVSQVNPPVGGAYVQNIKNMKAGAGEVVKWNNEGFFIGDENFADAPFRVDYTGKMVATDGTFTGAISGSSVTGGTITGTNIVTDTIKDNTYSLNGVFCKTHTSTNTSGTFLWNTGISSNGGLLNATLNYVNNANGQYNWLPGFNVGTGTSYFHVIKDAGVYKVRYYASNIYGDVTYSTLYFTLLFNSIETNGW